MASTRGAILDYLHAHHRATVKELAATFSLTPTAIRQHLAVLEEDELVQAREERGRVGRPARLYTLTNRGEARYPKQYDLLATLLIDEVRAMAGADALQRVMRRISERLARQSAPRVEGKSLPERVEVAAAVLREQGSLAHAEAGESEGEHFLHERTCPYLQVARHNRAVCALEVDLVRRITGADARLVSSLLRGDPACVYRIRPLPDAQPSL